MTYAKVDLLESKWCNFENHLNVYKNLQAYHLPEIQKLITAEYVVDISAHAIFTHTKYLQQFTLELMKMRDEVQSESVLNICKLWTELLTSRNQKPLKIKHNKRLDGECTFHLSLQMMNGLSYGFKEIQVLNANNKNDLQEAVNEIKYLGYLAHGFSFAGLPWMEDKVLSSVLKHEDTLCFLAKDKNDQIVGYSWGLLLRDVPVGGAGKANVFWVMDLAKHPDFYDPEIKVGEVLRETIKETVAQLPDCHFLGYQHILNHKFHVAIVKDGIPNTNETIKLGDNQYQATSMMEYEIDEFKTVHIVRSLNNEYPYPEYKVIEPALMSAFGKAAPDIFDFVLGGVLVFGRMYYQQWTHSLLNEPVEYRIEESISPLQNLCDMQILKTIILDKIWDNQGSLSLFQSCAPSHIQGLRDMQDYDFNILKQQVATASWKISRSTFTKCFYEAVTQSSNATTVLNILIKNSITPKEWVKIITEGRLNATLKPNERIAI